MRAVFVADVHACNHLPYAKVDLKTGVSDRLLDVVNIFEQIRSYCVSCDVRRVFILGDLFHKRLLDAVTLKTVVDALARLAQADIEIWILAGNHDASDADALHYTVDAFGGMGMKNVRLLDGPCEFEGVSFLALPYKPETSARQYLKVVEEALPDRSNIFLLMHQTVLGAKMGGWLAPDGLTPEELAPYAGVLTGHFHTHQHFLPHGFYLGAPIQHGFGDVGEERGFWFVDFNPPSSGSPAAMYAQKIRVIAPEFFTFSGLFVEGVLVTPQALDAAFHPRGCYVQLSVERPPDMGEIHEQMVADWRAEMMRRGAREVKVRWTDAKGPQKARIKVEVGQEGKISLPLAMMEYVAQSDVGSLSSERLVEIGLLALQNAREVAV